jgi:beta-glucosidase
MHPYQDAKSGVDARVADLLGRMTLDEKVAQLGQRSADGFPLDETADDALARDWPQAPGCVFFGLKSSLEENAERVRRVQRFLRTRTRLGIPALVGCEALHGVVAAGATVYPQSIALGATWNPALVREMGVQIAREAAAAGVTQALAPVLDLGRDPRYGRIEECYGESPTLVARLGVAYIAGMQGEDAHAGLAADKVFCTAKHFAGYSIPANGINIAPVLVGPRELRARHLVPFEAAVREARIMAVMPSYNAVDGVPSHANAWLLTELLRGEWGFEGFVYSDWDGIGMNVAHRVAPDKAAAAAQALAAGVDLEAPELQCFRHLPRLIAEGRVAPAAIDRAVARVLRAKFVAGLFDGRPDGDPAAAARVARQPAHVAHARRLAEESVILLKNEGNLLPLAADTLRGIAVIGPNADQVEFGDYCWTKSNRHGVNVLQALRHAVGDRLTIRHAKGCDLAGLGTEGFAAAVEAARQSSVAIVVLGDTSGISSGVGWEDPTVPMATVGEGFDVNNPVPPGVQEDLVRAVVGSGTPTIVILLSGRPYCIPWMKDHVPAIVQAFYPGEQQGHALVDILFGRVNPSGRLPVTVARSAGHIPCTHDFMPYGRGYYRNPGQPGKPGQDYVFDVPDPLWPFGFGLSYTTFAYSGLEIETPDIARDTGRLRFAFTVTNTGVRAGRVTPQVYWRDLTAQVAPPEKTLLRFDKFELVPGESRRVRFEVPAGEFRSVGLDARWAVEPGENELQVGDHAEAAMLTARFRIVSVQEPR